MSNLLPFQDSAIHLAAVSNTHHVDNDFCNMHLVDNPVICDANPVGADAPAEARGADGNRIVRQRVDQELDFATDCSRKAFDFFGDSVVE